MEGTVPDIDGGELWVGDLSPFRVSSCIDRSFNGETGGSRCGSDQLDDYHVREQGFAAPVLGDEGEHSVLDAVPLAGAGRMVSDGDGQSGLIGELLQLELP